MSTMPSDENVAYVYGGDLASFPSVYHYLEKGLEKNPHGPAVRDHLSQLAGPEPEGFREKFKSDQMVWMHTQLRHAAVRVATGLVARGVKRGSMLLTLMSNRVEWALLQYAATICGATFVPLDFGALTEPRETELQNFMSRLGPNAIFVANSADASAVDLALDKASQATPGVKVVLDEQPNPQPRGWMSLLDLVGAQDSNSDEEQRLLASAAMPDPDRISLLCFTSGTSSGKPKGCPRHAGAEAATIEGQKESLRLEKTSRYILASANFRIIAPALSLAVWSQGGAIVMPSPGFDPRTVTNAIQEHHITHVLFVPAQLHALAKYESFSPQKTHSIKYAGFGGDMITKEFLFKAQRSFPTAKIVARHGMTEGGSAFSWPYYEAGVDAVPDFSGISALGKVGPGAALRIYDDENNRVVQRGETGHFQINSPTLIKHYLEDVDEDAFVVDETGARWFRTGDTGFINEDGVVFLLGRLNDRIKRAGIRITPAALETSLSAYIGSQVSVFGITHPELGHEPYVVVESFNDKTEDEIKKHVIDVFGEGSAMAGASTLKQLGLSQFPLNATGKIIKTSLREAVMSYLGRSPGTSSGGQALADPGLKL